MHTEELVYHDKDTRFVSYVAYDEAKSGQRPAVIIVPAFEGRVDLYDEYARRCAELGYVGVTIDMYGDGQTADSLEGCMGFIGPMFQDRSMIRTRVLAAVEAVKNLAQVDSSKIAAFGFCFGGLVALDLARSGADVLGVVSIHGVLTPPEDLPSGKITAKVIALHGYDDPQVPPDQLAGFAKEMDAAQVDWQFTFYGATAHAFTDPNAAKIGPPEMGRIYNPTATQRAWQACQDFFKEIF